MKKIIFSLFVIALMVFLAAGCQKEETVTGEETAAETAEQAAPEETPAETAETETPTAAQTKELLENLSKEKGLIAETTKEQQQTIPGELTDLMPSEVEVCDEKTTFLYNGCYNIVQGVSDNVELSLLNAGRETIEGFWLYITFANGVVKYSELERDIESEDDMTYELHPAEWEAEIGSKISTIEIHGEELVDGKILSCYNQRVRFAPRVNCHDRIESLD